MIEHNLKGVYSPQIGVIFTQTTVHKYKHKGEQQ